MTKTGRWILGAMATPILVVAVWFPMKARRAMAQGTSGQQQVVGQSASDTARMAAMADHAMGDMRGPMGADENMMKHMELTPLRTPTHADSLRATRITAELQHAIAKYTDTAAAVADGYKMFLPNLKGQRIYHFTNYRHAFMAESHFDPTKPTSLLYKRGADGRLQLIGAMYTAPKNASLARLDDRVPLGIARWHKHVNWCLPKKGDQARWLEQRNGKPVFGPGSPIATKAECDAVNGVFHPSLFGWMIHANVFEGHDLASIWSDDDHGAAMHDHKP
jgi:hypothetical protein